MLHAINAKKARLDRVIDGIGKQPRENLITSALFGTIEFLSAPAQKLALRALIGLELPGNAEIFLWPYLRHLKENAEPDVVLRVSTERGPVYWVVEVKWGAPFGNEQIGREIRTLRDGECYRGGLPAEYRKVIGYVLLGAETKHAEAMQEAEGELPDLSFHSVTWPEATNRLRRLAAESCGDSGLAAWARTAGDFLRGTPRGSVLVPWPPDIMMPRAESFTFAAGRQFDFKNSVGSVTAAQSNFTKRDI
ncbi:hypothetical protein [Paracoccus marinus]|uniref:hypothetical protein n=1 Tax=Paracoccus marinus TaxID=288426 RepID=UPI00103A1F5D|nr:hypothetical protein [Paracoccus marinus]BDD46308.1 hypothetical protein 8 [Moraxellaceae bacterium]GLS81056.1 hypothetical protein GCM10007893_18550 [Paracoccus marinus]